MSVFNNKLDLWHRTLIFKQFFDMFAKSDDLTQMSIILQQLYILKGKVILAYHRFIHRVNKKYESALHHYKSHIIKNVNLDKYYNYLCKFEIISQRVSDILQEATNTFKSKSSNPNLQLGGNRQKYQKKNPTFYNFYSETCTVANKFMPTWKKVEDELRSLNINMVKVNCDKNTAFCLANKIEKAPTLQLLFGGNIYEYVGPRNNKDIINFVRDTLGSFHK